ncbi:MAG: ubiquitin-like protein Pup [Actinobacteria bacterium]|nr:ubiquitin-like protein Pup [Actinomycetota bacterium]
MPTRESGGGQSKATRRSEESDEVEASVAPESDVKERHEKLTDDVDDMLDEIDGVLEENSEEFVRSFVQKGGE